MNPTTAILRAIDGPLVDAAALRADVVARMAKDLVKYEAYGVETDAIRSLMNRGYSPYHVLRWVDDARQVAMQEIVAREMSEP